MKPVLLFASVFALMSPPAVRAWDYEGHRMVNQLALASLPPEFPAFVREPANAERIAFLAGEPDRWRNTNELSLKHFNEMDHYLDMEQITEAGLDFDKLPSLRMEFAMQFAAARAQHPDHLPVIDPAKNSAHMNEWPGFLPWAIAENYGKLKSAFSYLKTFEETGGTPEEIANAKANIIYIMGVMGHYVGDGAQPLHTTENHNGWTLANPKGYTKWAGIHSMIDGGFIKKAHITISEVAPKVRPASLLSLTAREDGRDAVFAAIIDYLKTQHEQMEPLYQLEKDGKFKTDVFPVNPEARAFIDTQLLAGGEMLGAFWLTAWKSAPPDTYLRATLLKRQAAAQPATTQ